MPVYPDAITESLTALSNAGDAAQANAEGRAVNFACGGFVAIGLTVADGDGTVFDSKFRSNGCGYMVAAADAVCSRLKGEALGGLHGLEHLREEIGVSLGQPEPERTACLDAAVEAARAAFADLRRRRIQEFAGEAALICTCFGISEASVLEFIGKAHPASVDDVSDGIRAGSGCGSCRMLIQELLDAARTDPHQW